METHKIIDELVRSYWDNEDSYFIKEIDKLQYELNKHELLSKMSKLNKHELLSKMSNLKNRLEL